MIRGSWLRTGVGAASATVIGLIANFVSGVIIARQLSAIGRGAVIAVQVGPLLGGFLFGLGVTPTVARFVAARSHPAREVLGFWLILLIPSGLCATLAMELSVKILLAAQTEDVVQVGQLVALTTAPAVVIELLWGVLLGRGRFVAHAVVRMAPSVLIAISYSFAAATGTLTFHLAVILNVIANLIPLPILILSVWSEGLAIPSRNTMRACFLFGLRAHGATVGDVVNGRLDLLLIPAYLSAAAIGIYSVATNVASLIITFASVVITIVLPLASRASGRAQEVLRVALTLTLLGAGTACGALAVVGPQLIVLVYGEAFQPAGQLLRILLPGILAYALARIFIEALLATGYPLRGSVSQFVGIVITIPSLIFALPRYGATGAAVATDIAYVGVLVTAVWFHRYQSKFPWSAYLASGAELLRLRRRSR